MSELEKCMRALEAIGKSRVEKSANYGSKSQKVQKAMAIARGSETPQGAVLVRRILQLQRQRAAGLGYGIPVTKERVTAKNGPLEMQSDDELLASLKEVTRELKRRGYVEEEEDDWSSYFEEV